MSSGSQPQVADGTGRATAIDTSRPARGGEVHERSSRPRPACWYSATSTDPGGASSRSALVDSVSSTTSNDVQGAVEGGPQLVFTKRWTGVVGHCARLGDAVGPLGSEAMN